MNFKTENGAEVVLNIASFKDAMNLKNAIGKELSKSDIDLKKVDLNTDLSEMFNIILAIDCSDDVFKAIFKCLERSTYDGFKITENTFEDEKAREDYYEVIIECLRINLSPFFKGLTSRLKNITKPTQEESPQ